MKGKLIKNYIRRKRSLICRRLQTEIPRSTLLLHYTVIPFTNLTLPKTALFPLLVNQLQRRMIQMYNQSRNHILTIYHAFITAFSTSTTKIIYVSYFRSYTWPSLVWLRFLHVNSIHNKVRFVCMGSPLKHTWEFHLCLVFSTSTAKVKMNHLYVWDNPYGISNHSLHLFNFCTFAITTNMDFMYV